MADVIDIAGHLPKADPELVDKLRSMLTEALNGRLTAFAAAYYNDLGDLETRFHFESTIDAVAATAILHRDALDFLTE